MKYVFLIFSLIPRLLWSQYYFDFEIDTIDDTGNYTNEKVEQYPAGRWDCLREEAISGTSSLHHNFDNQESGCDYFILTLDPLLDTDSLTFSFRVKHAYPPSSSNNWQVAVLAEFEDGQIGEGLILGVNYSGSDDLVKLWDCQQGNCQVICSTVLNYQEQIGIEIAPQFKLVWTLNGKLKIYFTRDPNGEPPEQIGSCLLDFLPGGRQLVVRYEYSSSQDRNLWIDDLVLGGHFVSDTLAPFITGVEVLDDLHMEISFSESVIPPAGYSFQLSGSSLGSMNPDTVYIFQQKVRLKFPRSIPNREEHQLFVEGICDIDANCLSDTSITCLRNEAEWGDVVFNELMVDPVPAVLLPEEEYLEIYNRSDYEINLSGWRIEVNDRSYPIGRLILESQRSMAPTLPAEPFFKLGPDSYRVITGMSFPNDGATLALYNEKEALIHAIRYDIPWNAVDWKMEGGWSLESPDPDQVCNISELWEYSSNPIGGTPGRINSNDTELEDDEPPVFLYPGYGYEEGYLGQQGVISLHYSEPVLFNLRDLDQMLIIPGYISADSVVPELPVADQLNVWFPANLHERLEFKVKIPALADCSKNLSHSLEFRAGKVSKLQYGSVLINEIMYDPEEGAPEYIELYLPGNGFYDLRDLAIGVVTDDSYPVSPVPLSDHSHIISPGEYLVVSKNIRHLMDVYKLELSGRWIEVKEVDVMPNSGGTVYLTDRAGTAIDMAFYGDHLHMELLDDPRGISLERVSTERPGIDADNWHSAASIEGYSTPGRENSQSLGVRESDRLLDVEPEVFSPDNDGYNDLLNMTITTGAYDWVVGLWITDLQGNRIRVLANNHLAGPSLNYIWDGEGENGTMQPMGFYVVHARGYHPSTGERWVRRRAVGLVYR